MVWTTWYINIQFVRLNGVSNGISNSTSKFQHYEISYTNRWFFGLWLFFGRAPQTLVLNREQKVPASLTVDSNSYDEWDAIASWRWRGLFQPHCFTNHFEEKTKRRPPSHSFLISSARICRSCSMAICSIVCNAPRNYINIPFLQFCGCDECHLLIQGLMRIDFLFLKNRQFRTSLRWDKRHIVEWVTT